MDTGKDDGRATWHRSACRACASSWASPGGDICDECRDVALLLLETPHGHSMKVPGDVTFGPVGYKAAVYDGNGNCTWPAHLVLGDAVEGDLLEVNPHEAGRLGWALIQWARAHTG